MEAIDEGEANRVREIFRQYLELGSVYALKDELDRRGWTTPARPGKRIGGGRPFTRGHLYRMLSNAIYFGQIAHKGVIYPGQHPGIVEPALWDAVQAKLAANLQGHRTQSNAADPSLLAGLAFDEQGVRLQPSHAKKGAKRYRYYFRAAEGQQRAIRIPATELESAVINALVEFLRDEVRDMDAFGRAGAGVVRARLRVASALAQRLESAAASDRIAMLQRLIARIAVAPASLEIVVRHNAAWSDAAMGSQDEDTTSIVVPVQLKRCGSAVRLIVRGAQEDKARGPDPRLLALLAKAQRWFSSLSSGRYPSVLAIAQEQGLASRDVTEVIYLAFLAPDIVQKIVHGEQPIGLGTKKLLAMTPLPLDWGEQRTRLGFES